MNHAPCDLIVFDLDGTLIDTRRDIIDSVNRLLVARGHATLPDDRIMPMIGLGMRHLVREALLAATGSDAGLDHALHEYASIYEAHMFDAAAPYPGVREALPSLEPVLAVLTNKGTAFAVRMLDVFGMRAWFRHIVGGDTPHGLKPDPTGLRAIIAACGTSPERTLMVGDSVHDIEAGRAAGARTCAVTHGFQPEEALRISSPDFLLHHFGDLMGIAAGRCFHP